MSPTTTDASSGAADLHRDTVKRTPVIEPAPHPGGDRRRTRTAHRPAAEQQLIAIATAVDAALAAAALRTDRTDDRRTRTVAP